MFNNKLFVTLLMAVLVLTGCAGITPRNQSVNFATPPMPVVNTSASDKEDLIHLASSSNSSDKEIAVMEKKISTVQENYNAVQNSLVGISGKLADFKTDINKLAEINSEIAAIKGDVELQSQILSTIKAEVKAELVAEVKAEIRAEMNNEINGVKAQVQGEVNGLKANFNNNSNLPLSFMIIFGVLVLGVVVAFTIIIMQNNSQRKELKALKESTPVILPQ